MQALGGHHIADFCLAVQAFVLPSDPFAGLGRLVRRGHERNPGTLVDPSIRAILKVVLVVFQKAFKTTKEAF